MVIDTLLPSITLTDPSNKDQPPSPALSPLSPIGHDNAASSLSSRVSGAWNSVREDVSSIPQPAAAAADQGTWRAISSADASKMKETSDSALNRSPGKSRKTRLNNAAASTTSTIMNIARRDTRGGMEDPREHAIDPLTSHIRKRTSTSPAVTRESRRTSSETASLQTDDARSVRSRSPQPQPRRSNVSDQTRDDLKKGVKAVSFLSRLMGAKKKENSAEDQVPDNESVTSEQPEGNEAEVFSRSPETTSGFSLRTTQPPGYIKVRAKYKEKRDFERLFLAQEIQCGKPKKITRTDSNRLRRKHSGPAEPGDTIWAMEFSRDGQYLAAGADNVLRVWKVLSSVEDRKTHEQQEAEGSTFGSVASEHTSAPVFQSEPYREYEGHEAPILDISWSKNSFLLSSSMDKTVRLWHVSRAECICTFKHNDFVPSIAFHPKDDRYFLAGSLDSKLRLWSIPDKNVAFSATAPDMITAVAFMSDGKFAVAGTSNGSCLWYETEGFKYKTQLQIRPDRGTGVQGPKITGIQSAFGRGGEKLLVTSNDSRVRLYNVRDKGCEMIFRGHVNDASQIRASLSDDGRYVVCGSEDKKAYVWSVVPTETGKLDKRPVEYFDAHDTPTTVVRVAPIKTRRLLSQSEDPIYDLCNPPHAGNGRIVRTDSMASARPTVDLGQSQSSDTRGDLSRSGSLLAKSAHKGGNIIVTADYAGKIKVFRQDCAWSRRQRDDWDRSSLFRRENRNSLASSLHTKSSQRSLREAKNAAMSQVASTDRINSWRQDITSTSFNSSHHGSPRIKPQSEGSSPVQTTSRVSGSESHETATSGSPSTVPTSTGSGERPVTAVPESGDKDAKSGDEEKPAEDPLFLDGNRSYMFWDKNSWTERQDRARQMFHQSLDAATKESEQLSGGVMAPTLNHTISYVSQLSDEHAVGSDEEVYNDAEEHQNV